LNARLFGLEFNTSFPFIRAAGELPAREERKVPPNIGDLGARAVASDPLGDWYLALPAKLEPKQVEQILRGALAGNIWQQTQLCQKMRDSWPMFAKCSYELRQALSQVKFMTRPATEPEGDTSKKAQEKADLVEKAMKTFLPDRFSDEDGFSGMLFDLTDAILNGVSIVELMWEKNEEGLWMPRASAWVHPRHYAFNPDGKIGVAEAGRYDPMLFQTTFDRKMLDNRDKFLVAKFKSKSGSCLGAGFMRPLAWYWVGVMYGRDFLITFAQKYGAPFMDIPYQAGIPAEEVLKFEAAAKRAAALNYMVHPNTGEVKITQASQAGTDNPQRVLMQLADDACMMLMLGQTLTSAAPINGGTRAQGEVHAGVRRELIEGYAAWLGKMLTEQFCTSLMDLNYGETDEKPVIEPDFTEVEDPIGAATRWNIILSMAQGKLPVKAEEVYEGIGIEMPEEGDKVMLGGVIGILGSTDLPVQTNKPAPEIDAFGNTLDEFGNLVPGETAMDKQMEMQMSLVGGGGFGEPSEPESPEPEPEETEKTLAARGFTPASLRTILAHATAEELGKVREAVLKAKASGHLNGEQAVILATLKDITQRTGEIT
jgi:phage gp29-like protein